MAEMQLSYCTWDLPRILRSTIGRAAGPSAAAASRRRAAASRRYVALFAPHSACTSHSSSQKATTARAAVATAMPPRPPSHRRRACKGSWALDQHPARLAELCLAGVVEELKHIQHARPSPCARTCATAIRCVRLRRLSHTCAWHRWWTISPCRRRSAAACCPPPEPLPSVSAGRHCSASSKHACFSAAAAAGRQGSGSDAQPGSPRRCAASWPACSTPCQSARHVAFWCGGEGRGRSDPSVA